MRRHPLFAVSRSRGLCWSGRPWPPGLMPQQRKRRQRRQKLVTSSPGARNRVGHPEDAVAPLPVAPASSPCATRTYKQPEVGAAPQERHRGAAATPLEPHFRKIWRRSHRLPIKAWAVGDPDTDWPYWTHGVRSLLCASRRTYGVRCESALIDRPGCVDTERGRQSSFFTPLVIPRRKPACRFRQTRPLPALDRRPGSVHPRSEFAGPSFMIPTRQQRRADPAPIIIKWQT